VSTSLGRFKTKESAKLLTKLAESDESVLVASAASRALGATRRPEAYETLVALLDEPSWAEVIRAGAIGGLAELRDERAVDVLKERTKYGEPTRARRAAIAAISRIATGRKTREHLEELLEDHDPHLRVTVADALGELGDVKARVALRRQLERDLDGRVRRRIREVLRDLGGRGRRDMRGLREEVDELRKQHGELKARMSKLEARLNGARPPRKHDRK
jgi:aminopeptidase N